MSQNTLLFYLHDLPGYELDSGEPDIRGWKLNDLHDNTIGHVENLVVSRKDESVKYLEVKLTDEILSKNPDNRNPHLKDEAPREFVEGMDRDHFLLPIGLVTLHPEAHVVRTEKVSEGTFVTAARRRRKDPFDTEYELQVVEHFGGNTAGYTHEKAISDDFYNQKPFENKGFRKGK
ncbi:MAG: hypothetical protein WBB45_00825 [Cyclobacteriaceae bacterium]